MVQEASVPCTEKIKSVGGANRKRRWLEPEAASEDEVESSSEKEEVEEEPMSQEPSEKAALNISSINISPKQPCSNASVTSTSMSKQHSPASNPSSNPAVFIPVDRTAEIQVSEGGRAVPIVLLACK